MGSVPDATSLNEGKADLVCGGMRTTHAGRCGAESSAKASFARTSAPKVAVRSSTITQPFDSRLLIRQQLALHGAIVCAVQRVADSVIAMPWKQPIAGVPADRRTFRPHVKLTSIRSHSAQPAGCLLSVVSPFLGPSIKEAAEEFEYSSAQLVEVCGFNLFEEQCACLKRR